MKDENRTVTKITEQNQVPVPLRYQMTEEQMRKDYYYYLAQKIIKLMLYKGLISVDEYNKITEKNRQTFSPYLAEIML
ncbi:SHOCT domain-containing protein [uncultured Clostridium sp.]|uniref:SHOCT domain-containing protein n=1 Tax=uncultured Clostridium sp. TaxID=59620 RepID=UPI0027DDB9A2|nr:SHOCT domain-containing protein [uncultured Clostridium sp.]